jgi:hypothetical protein
MRVARDSEGELMAASDREIHLAGTAVSADSHICAFFHNQEEEYRTLLPFLREGLAQGDRCILIVNGIDRDEHMRRLRDAGLDAGTVQRRGQVEVVAWPKTLMSESLFDEDSALELIAKILDGEHRQGYPRTRLFGDWALDTVASPDNFMCLEARLNPIVSKHHDPVICAYNLSRFSSAAVLGAMRTHPVAIVGGVLQRNPFYVQPGQILDECRERARFSR